MNLQQVHQFLLDNRYILASKEKGYVLSKSYQDDVKKMKREQVDVVPRKSEYPRVPADCYSIELIPPIARSLSKTTTGVDWVEWFTRLITDAKIPRQLEDNRGNCYATNKYSEDGMKAFRKAIESGVDYEMLVKSTMLYYKSNIKYKKAVGNYFAQGDWRTDYQNLSEAALSGTTELTNHIKQETQTNEHNPYRRG